jgi:hypothetical protein
LSDTHRRLTPHHVFCASGTETICSQTVRLCDAANMANAGEHHVLNLNTNHHFDEKHDSGVPLSASGDEKGSLSEGDSIRTGSREAYVDDGAEKNVRTHGSASTETTADLEAVLKVKSKGHSVSDASTIPNGGFWAWMQVLGAFFLFFNSWYVDPLSLMSCRAQGFR